MSYTIYQNTFKTLKLYLKNIVREIIAITTIFNKFLINLKTIHFKVKM